MGLIAGFLLVVLIVLGVNELRSQSLVDALIQTSCLAALEQVNTQRAAFRDFWIEVIDTVLLNVLLPVLTALLGYIFGTTNRLSTDR